MGLSLPLTREALEAAQLERINRSLAYAVAHSAFYREHLPVSQVKSLEEFSRLPFTSPEDVRQNGTRLVCVSGAEIERVFTVLETSGSSGRPKRIYFTAEEQESTVDYFHHGMLEFAEAGETAVILFPGTTPGSLNLLLSEALRRMKVTPVIFGFPRPKEYSEVLEKMIELKAQRLIGPPFLIAALAEYSRRLKLDHRLRTIVRGVLVAGSFVSEQDCRTIYEAWECHIDEEYGMTETGLAGAVGCRQGGGYHPWESDLYYEIVDPDSGAPVPEGTQGEIVVTTLTRIAMPLLRYRTGDLSRLIPGSCPCGSVLRHLARVGDRCCGKKYRRFSYDEITSL